MPPFGPFPLEKKKVFPGPSPILKPCSHSQIVIRSISTTNTCKNMWRGCRMAMSEYCGYFQDEWLYVIRMSSHVSGGIHKDLKPYKLKYKWDQLKISNSAASLCIKTDSTSLVSQASDNCLCSNSVMNQIIKLTTKTVVLVWLYTRKMWYSQISHNAYCWSPGWCMHY